jgi:hypothetical protein
VVLNHGSIDLIRRVENGEISASAAAKQAQPPKPKPTPQPSRPQPKPNPDDSRPVIYVARIKSAFFRVERAAADGNVKLFQKELRHLIAAAQEQMK